ncbi:hypothetical protein AKJ66_03505 [candidate division MSBL1 archaeon SCGC-AAA259E22]|uniref:Stage II sporulation protein M n=1 Tax=candidate division MSBL1 archaeon SCGC-AAA259E22 TaxID=1698265 RepID=A0A133UFB4_9EURY|nr:hypothetical protein AKJ66_03505 [candidate division MSBL1 archaeon SCGC-AAA259E22]
MLKKYVISLKWYLALSSILFLCMAILGYIFGGELSYLWENLQEYFGGLAGFHPLILIALVFVNNSIASLIAILLGVTLGIVPLLVSAVNGLIIGLAGFHTLQTESLTFFVLGILPHGVIEIPMFLLSTAIGIRIGVETIKKILGRESTVKRRLKNDLKFYAVRILPLLILAALIEILITSSILMMF